MKIKKYEKSALSNAQVALNANEEKLISTMNTADEPGTKDNPYSLWEMCEMILAETWEGGYVLFLGKVEYIAKDDFVKGSADGASDGMIVRNDKNGSSEYEYEEEQYFDNSISLIKPSSDFDIASAGHSSDAESSSKGSETALSGKNYTVYHEVIYFSDRCKLTVEQMVYKKCVYVSISTYNTCTESDIPSIRCKIRSAGNCVTQLIYNRQGGYSTIRSNTPIAKFGYYRLDGEVVSLLMNEDSEHPYYITTY